MLFCPKCSSILMPKVDKNKKLLVCSCGFKKEAEENLVIKETISQKSESTGAGVAEDKEILPLVDADCPKCKHIKHTIGLFKLELQMKLQLDFSSAKNANILGESINSQWFVVGS
jgi:DNA-directed RNA polymerase subunit M/transcription elongation factor TFIIS